MLLPPRCRLLEEQEARIDELEAANAAASARLADQHTSLVAGQQQQQAQATALSDSVRALLAQGEALMRFNARRRGSAADAEGDEARGQEGDDPLPLDPAVEEFMEATSGCLQLHEKRLDDLQVRARCVRWAMLGCGVRCCSRDGGAYGQAAAPHGVQGAASICSHLCRHATSRLATDLLHTQAAVPMMRAAAKERAQVAELQRQVSSLETMLAVLTGGRCVRASPGGPFLTGRSLQHLHVGGEACTMRRHCLRCCKEPASLLPSMRPCAAQARHCGCRRPSAANTPHARHELRAAVRAARDAAAGCCA